MTQPKLNEAALAAAYKAYGHPGKTLTPIQDAIRAYLSADPDRAARPDDAEARERLHRWVMAMMPTLNAMAAEDMGMDDCRDAIDIVSEIAAELQLPDGWDDDTLMEALRNAR